MPDRKPPSAFDFEKIFAVLAEYYANCEAAVKKFEQVSAATPLQILIAAMLSARTNDRTTTKVMSDWGIERLEQLQGLSAQELEKIVYPVGFYKQKALHLSKWCEHIEKHFGGKLPTNRQQTMSLPGVGLKTANLYLSRAYGLPFVCVDIHVHRICGRLGLTSYKTPQQTEKELSRILPKKFISDANRYFVALGQTLCKAQKTDCENCPLSEFCARIGV